MNTFVLYFIFHLFSSSVHGDGLPLLTRDQIQSAVSGRFDNIPNLPNDHPDFPILNSLRVLTEKPLSPKVRIDRLEALLQLQQFSGILTHGKNQEIGTVGSYGVWRDLIYVQLGRAYYEIQNYKLAAHFFSGVPQNSPLAALARTEEVWAHINNSDFLAAKLLQKKISDLPQPSRQVFLDEEFLILNAYISLKDQKPEESLKTLAALPKPKNFTLRALALKVKAQAQFAIFLATKNKNSFSTNQQNLQQALDWAEQVPKDFHDGDFAFFASESHWHMASLLRVEDPVKYKTSAIDSLKKADAWLRPWYEKSVKENKPLLNEEALFFSAVILWEQQAYQAAVQRLHALPSLFPQGEYLEDAYQLLGDYYFENKQFVQANDNYRKLAAIGHVEKAAYGTYKAAWSFYNKKEKWEALRHFQRLSLYYRQNFPDENKLPPGHLKKEADRDMRLLLAELLTYPQAKSELEIFQYNVEEWVNAREALAKTYKQMGNYTESVVGWRDLIQNTPLRPDRLYWLTEMLACILADGARARLSSAINEHLPLFKISTYKTQDSHLASFEKDLTQTILTVHREARKTDDTKIWTATDDLYQTFINFFPNSEIGEIWYYGAQRKEQLAQIDTAINWYMMAAQIKSFENHEDSRVSALRLVSQKSDKESLKTKPEVAAWATIADQAFLHIKLFPKAQEYHTAVKLYLEGLHNSNQRQKGHSFLIELFKESAKDPALQAHFVSENKRLYHIKNWREIYTLSSTLLNLKNLKNEIPDFAKKLTTIVQESAFQVGYNLENSTPLDPQYAKWYELAITTNPKANLALKAWHNWCLRGDLEIISRFENSYKPPEELNFEQRELIRAIYEKKVILLGELQLSEEQAQAIAQTIKWQDDEDIKTDLHFKAAIRFAIVHDTNNFLHHLTAIPKQHPILNKATNKESIVRLLYLNDKKELSWEALKDQLPKASLQSPLWLTLVDLFKWSKSNDHNLFIEVKEFLNAHVELLKKNSLVTPILGEVFDQQFPPSELTHLTVRSPEERAPAALSFQARADSVVSILSELAATQKKLLAFTKHWIPQVSLEALCAANILAKSASHSLQRLKSPPIEDAQWPQFMTRLDEKIQELHDRAIKENELCAKEKQRLSLLNLSAPEKNPICSWINCNDRRPASFNKNLNESKPILDQIAILLQHGRWAQAEDLAYNRKSSGERSLLLGFLRVAHDDPWNATPLLLEAQKSDNLKNSAKLFLALAEFTSGDPVDAKNHLQNVNPEALSGWEVKIFKKLASEVM